MPDDDKPQQTFDRRGPEEIEPGHKGGNAESQARSVTKDASHSDKPETDTLAEEETIDGNRGM
ncbi:hypothetical protein Q8W71_30195 [Methylobacterium sp. NEAU 140]|uniref:hypothetical protein n=1 Tax=Methylobacterium sp. NEAU 140 TaxID=3064945 RepID=UPI00273626FD|nr:hypothetical protein [Methylobacterium sp. NEAU 140]MDP4026871.1 hypothetical protein [Methylobacterium sp. NEAU 140]